MSTHGRHKFHILTLIEVILEPLERSWCVRYGIFLQSRFGPQKNSVLCLKMVLDDFK
jgi:hypothetical protein